MMDRMGTPESVRPDPGNLDSLTAGQTSRKSRNSMQDRYAGDIGDYGKIALLKALQAQGLSIGVNWYKTNALENEKNPDGSYKQDDGKYAIPEKYWSCDQTLAKKLLDIFHSKNRSISALEEADLIPRAIYYNEPVTVNNRGIWHKTALEKLRYADIVFLDPDNGMLIKSVGKGSIRSVKYTFYEEVHDYINQSHSVLIYNHRSRKPEEKYFHEICERLQCHTDIASDCILKITFPKFSVRDYLAIPVSEEHSKKIQQAFADMEQGIWGELGVCRIPKY